MIEIEIKLFATLVKYRPKEADTFKLPDRTTIAELLSKLNIPEEETKLLFVNGKKQPLEYEVQNGDRVGIFPPVGGG
jgi:molybdopterin converting factor small subunit